MQGNKLECNPWPSIFLKTRKSGINPSSHIPSHVIVQMENALNRDENLINWIASQISTRVIVLGGAGSGKTTFIQLVAN